MVQSTSPLLSLPAELRCMIYELVMGAKRVCQLERKGLASAHPLINSELLRVNKMINFEATPLFYRILTLKTRLFPTSWHVRHHPLFDITDLSRFCFRIRTRNLSHLQNLEIEIRNSIYYHNKQMAKDIVACMRKAGLTHIRCLTVSRRQWAGLSPFTAAQRIQQRLAKIGEFCFDRRLKFSKLIKCPIEIEKPAWPFYDYGLVSVRIKLVAGNVRLRDGESLVNVRNSEDEKGISEKKPRAELPVKNLALR
ncbi:MAG: hypothetical protein Q9160_006805 [Pyrenula sp. 1 TL-2023]